MSLPIFLVLAGALLVYAGISGRSVGHLLKGDNTVGSSVPPAVSRGSLAPGSFGPAAPGTFGKPGTGATGPSGTQVRPR